MPWRSDFVVRLPTVISAIGTKSPVLLSRARPAIAPTVLRAGLWCEASPQATRIRSSNLTAILYDGRGTHSTWQNHRMLRVVLLGVLSVTSVSACKSKTDTAKSQPGVAAGKVIEVKGAV